MAPTAVVIPLYIYPLPNAWTPLITAARANPQVPFYAIVNPSNGPGASVLPDASYQSALAALCAEPNITLLGYVHCTWTRRPAAEVLADIDIYANWARASEGAFSVRGIFIDEAPWETKHRPYMRKLADHTRRAFGSGSIVAYNPGVVVDQGYLEDADLVVVFEQSHTEWYAYFLQKGLVQIPYNLRSRCVAMVHSFGQLDELEKPASPKVAFCAPGAHGVGDQNGHGHGRRPSASLELDNAHKGGEERAATAVTDQITQLGFGGVFLTEQVGGYSHFPKVWDTVARRLTEKQRTGRI